ncbi:MAG: hypothetical protein LDL42_01435 [Rhizobium sp.]|nr:hypothetical protein [Rhizobium sp.]
MEFRLVFDGDLRPHQQIGLKEINKIRMELAPQLRGAWAYPPLSDVLHWKDQEPDAVHLNCRTTIEGVLFIPIISAKTSLFAEIDVLLLRAQAPGRLISNHGDIDNRLKTLLDALRVPSRDQVKKLKECNAFEDGPQYCLLEDDNLVTKLSVSTDRLLAEPNGSQRTLAVLSVRARPSRVVIGNIGFA